MNTVRLGSLHNKSFVITGHLSEGRELVKKYIIEHGGKLSGSVHRNNDYVVCGEFAHLNNNEPKVAKAKELGVEFITFAGLKDLVTLDTVTITKGDELSHNGNDLVVVLVDGGQACVRYDENGVLDILRTAELVPRKSPEQFELEAFLCGLDGDDVGYDVIAKALLEAGYRKVFSGEE